MSTKVRNKKILIIIAILISFVYLTLFFMPSDFRTNELPSIVEGQDELGDNPSGWQICDRGITWTKYYNNDTGQYRLLSYGGVVNYNDSGVWKAADASLSVADEPITISGRTYEYAMLQSVHNIWFRERSSQVRDRPVAFLHNGFMITYNPDDALKFDDGTRVSGKKNVLGVVDGDSIIYPEQYDTGIDLKYICDTSGLVEQLIIDNVSRLGNPDVGSELIKQMTVRSYKLDGEDETESMGIVFGSDMVNFKDYNEWEDNEIVTNGSVYFRDENNITMFYIPEVYAFDSNGSMVLLNKSMHMTRFGNLRMDIHVPYWWLFHENTTYPIVIDPTTELDYTSCYADIYAVDTVGSGFKMSSYYETMMRWDMSYLYDTDCVSVENATLKLYCAGGTGLMDDDAVISIVHNQTWFLPSVAEYNAMGEEQRISMHAFNATPITSGNWYGCNITDEVYSNFNDTNSSLSVRIEDYDRQAGSQAVNNIVNTTTLRMGYTPSLMSIPPRHQLAYFASCDYVTTAYRPSLYIEFTAVANLAPSVTDFYPGNDSDYIERYPDCMVTVDDPEDGNMDISWFNSSDGVDYTFQQFDADVSDLGTVYWNYSMADEYNTDYWWKVYVDDNDGNNESFWYNFTTTSCDAQEPLSFTATAWNGTAINVTWTLHENSSAVYLEYNQTGDTVWERGDGISLGYIYGESYNHTDLNYDTTYYYQGWGFYSWIECYSDQNSSDSETTDPSQPPVASSPNPANADDDVDAFLTTQLSVYLSDPDGNPMDWTIETLPDIGSSSGNGEGDGTKTCDITIDATHIQQKWWINATDNLGGDLNQQYTFYANWYPEMKAWIPNNESIYIDKTPTLYVTIDDQDDDSVYIYFESNYSGSWQIISSSDERDVTGGPVVVAFIATGITEPNTTYWWSTRTYDLYGDNDGQNDSDIFNFVTADEPQYSELYPTHTNMTETSPVTLSGYFEHPQGLNMNISWYDYEDSDRLLETDTLVANSSQTYIWNREKGTGEWYIIVESHNFTNTSSYRWFANNQSWDDDFNNTFLVNNTNNTYYGLPPLIRNSYYENIPYYNNSVLGDSISDVTLEASASDVTYRQSLGPTTVFINETHGFCFIGDGDLWVYNTTDGGATWTKASTSGKGYIQVAVWYDRWTYGLEGETIHIITTEGSYSVYMKYWWQNNTWSDPVNIVFTDNQPYRSVLGIAVAGNGEIWTGTYRYRSMVFPTFKAGYCRRSVDNGSTWQTMESVATSGLTTRWAYYSFLPIKDNGMMVFRVYYSGSMLSARPYWTDTQSWGTRVNLRAISSSYFSYDATTYRKTGDIYVAVLTNDLSSTADIYLHQYHAHNDTWNDSFMIKQDTYGGKPALACSQGNGDLYLAFGNGTGGATDIYESNSTDGGQTWSADQQINTVTDDLRNIHSNLMDNYNIFFEWTNDDLNDIIGCRVCNYTLESTSDNYGNVTSINFTRPTDTTWTYFNASVDETDNTSFSILDENGNILLDNLDGNQNDISSIEENNIALFVNLSNASKVYSWNVSWATTIVPSEWSTISTGWFNFSNTSSYPTFLSGYFNFSNQSSFRRVVSGYFSFSNSSSYRRIVSGWFNFTSGDRSYRRIESGWFNFSNSSSFTKVISGWFNFSNSVEYNRVISGWFDFNSESRDFRELVSGYFNFSNFSSSYRRIVSGWFTFNSGAREFRELVSGYFNFSNTSTLSMVKTGWFNFSNSSSYRRVESGWFTFGDTSAFSTVTSGWFNFSNDAYFNTLVSGWFNFSNTAEFRRVVSGWFDFNSESRTYRKLVSGWFNFSNTSSYRKLVSGYFNFSNIAEYQTVSSGWFAFNSQARTYRNVGSGYFNFSNTSSFRRIVSGWFTFGAEGRAYSAIVSGWFNFSNYSVFAPVTSGWFNFSNSTTYRRIVSGWFDFGSAVEFSQVSAGWFNFSSTIAHTTFLSGYFNFSNTTNYRRLVSGWFNFTAESANYSEVVSGYFTFLNTSSYRRVISGYFDFSNSSSYRRLVSGWFNFSNEIPFRLLVSGWFNWSNYSVIPIEADFNFTVVGHKIQCVDNSTGTIDFYRWVVIVSGNEAANTSWVTYQYFNHTVIIPGHYYVELCVKNSTTEDCVTKYIQEFLASPPSGGGGRGGGGTGQFVGEPGVGIIKGMDCKVIFFLVAVMALAIIFIVAGKRDKKRKPYKPRKERKHRKLKRKYVPYSKNKKVRAKQKERANQIKNDFRNGKKWRK